MSAFKGTVSRGHYCITSGFWPRVRARTLPAPVFLGSLLHPTGHCAPPHPSQLRCSYKSKNNRLFPETKYFPSGPNSGRQREGHIFFLGPFGIVGLAKAEATTGRGKIQNSETNSGLQFYLELCIYVKKRKIYLMTHFL
jgi:hypothetical protein